MPVKILLADKSITIQKVVEMLFSGRDYEVVCVSDGEAALNEVARVAPDVVLADVDLPRVDGYSLAARLKKTPQLAQVPVILMMSRDDVYDSAKGKQAGIVDNIAKPFESQELIGKVKKALADAPPRLAEPMTRPATASPQPAPASPASSAPAAAKVMQATPSDIFDIIQEAPNESEIKKAAAPAPVEEESVYEVEPEVEEVEEPLSREIAKSLPVGAKAVEEMRVGLGLSDKREEQPEIVPFESLDMVMDSEPTSKASTLSRPPAARQTSPSAAPVQSMLSESELRTMAEEAVAKMAKEAFEKVPLPQPPALPESVLRKMAEEAIEKMAKEAFANMPSPTISASDLWSMAEETVSKMAKDIFAQMPPIRPPQISEEKVRTMAEDMVSTMAKNAFGKMSLPQISEEALRGMVEQKVSIAVNEAVGKIELPKPPTLPESELRSMAEAAITKLAEDIVKDLPPPPMPKVSDETVRRGLEAVLSKIAREMAREVFEQVAWEVIPPLAEHLIKAEIERLKAME
ncbi:MAG: response regulator [Betaproteobacteria bacterium]